MKIEGLSVTYGTKNILKNLNFVLHENKINVILGPNGSGKSTLLKEIVKKYANEYNLSYIAQSIVGELEMTVYDFVSMGRFCKKDFFHKLTPDDRKIIDENLKILDLDGMKENNYDTLSGGEKKRTEIARALSQDYDYLIGDEITSGLDIKYVGTVKNIILDLKNKKSKTIILVLHDINLTYAIADNIILLKDGEIVASGSRDEVLTKSRLEKTYDALFERYVNNDDGNEKFIYNSLM